MMVNRQSSRIGKSLTRQQNEKENKKKHKRIKKESE